MSPPVTATGRLTPPLARLPLFIDFSFDPPIITAVISSVDVLPFRRGMGQSSSPTASTILTATAGVTPAQALLGVVPVGSAQEIDTDGDDMDMPAAPQTTEPAPWTRSCRLVRRSTIRRRRCAKPKALTPLVSDGAVLGGAEQSPVQETLREQLVKQPEREITALETVAGVTMALVWAGAGELRRQDSEGHGGGAGLL